MDYINNKKILIAGATGYLGSHVLIESLQRNYNIRALVRTEKQKKILMSQLDDVVIGEVTVKESLKNITKEVDIVFSSIGITRQKDGLTYMNVDYQGNLNLLNAAIESGVKKFIYVSIFNPAPMKNLEIIKAKELFVEKLKASGIEYTIIRPTGFFIDIKEVLIMAKTGVSFIIGNGQNKLNPISGRDLANICCDSFLTRQKEINIGGPEILSIEDITKLAFKVLNKKERIIYIPSRLLSCLVRILKLITSSKTYGPIEFFSKASTIDMVAPKYGNDKIKTFFEEIINKK